MKEPLKYKILSTLLMVICKLTGHEYGCCNNVFKRCSRCVYVKAEEEYRKELGDEYEWLHWDIRP